MHEGHPRTASGVVLPGARMTWLSGTTSIPDPTHTTETQRRQDKTAGLREIVGADQQNVKQDEDGQHSENVKISPLCVVVRLATLAEQGELGGEGLGRVAHELLGASGVEGRVDEDGQEVAHVVHVTTAHGVAKRVPAPALGAARPV